MLPGPDVPGPCLIFLHFLWGIHPIRPVIIPARFGEKLAEILCHGALHGWAAEQFEDYSRILTEMFLHNSVLKFGCSVTKPSSSSRANGVHDVFFQTRDLD